MSQLEDRTLTTQPRHPTALAERIGPATVVGTAALLLWPVAGSIGGLLETSVIGGVDPANLPGQLQRIAAHPGPWLGFGLLMWVMALLTALAAPAVWRLARARAPRWGLTAATVLALFVSGQFVHLTSWPALLGAMSALPPESATQLSSALDAQPLFTLLFVPFILGGMLAAPLAAVALWRARMLPVWSVIVAALTAAAIAVLGLDSAPMFIAFPLLHIVAFSPVVRHLRRAR